VAKTLHATDLRGALSSLDWAIGLCKKWEERACDWPRSEVEDELAAASYNERESLETLRKALVEGNYSFAMLIAIRGYTNLVGLSEAIAEGFARRRAREKGARARMDLATVQSVELAIAMRAEQADAPKRLQSEERAMESVLSKARDAAYRRSALPSFTARTLPRSVESALKKIRRTRASLRRGHELGKKILNLPLRERQHLEARARAVRKKLEEGAELGRKSPQRVRRSRGSS
jgi:hypothetical protein